MKPFVPLGRANLGGKKEPRRFHISPSRRAAYHLSGEHRTHSSEGGRLQCSTAIRGARDDLAPACDRDKKTPQAFQKPPHPKAGDSELTLRIRTVSILFTSSFVFVHYRLDYACRNTIKYCTYPFFFRKRLFHHPKYRRRVP